LLKLGAEIAKYEGEGNKLSIFVQDVIKKIIIRETTRFSQGRGPAMGRSACRIGAFFRVTATC
jgi:hypothetical protein